jgi:hypothetical protein
VVDQIVVELGLSNPQGADLSIQVADLASAVHDLGAWGSREADLQEPCLSMAETPCFQSLACPL